MAAISVKAETTASRSALTRPTCASNNSACVILPSRGPYDTMEKDMPQRVTVYPGFPPLFNQQQFVPPKDMLADPKP